MKSNNLVLVLLSLSGCAAMQEQIVRTTCNAEGARQLGYNHAREGEELRPDFITLCPDHQDELLLKAYREGYESAPKPFSSPPKQAQMRIRTKNHHCEATVDGFVYSASAPTESEARANLYGQCGSMAGECMHSTFCSQRD